MEHLLLSAGEVHHHHPGDEFEDIIGYVLETLYNESSLIFHMQHFISKFSHFYNNDFAHWKLPLLQQPQEDYRRFLHIFLYSEGFDDGV